MAFFTNAQSRIRNHEEQISFIFNLSNKFPIHEMGFVDYSEYSYKMYKITYNQSNANNKRFLIVSGIHGNEEAPVYALRDFILTLDL
jgi:predicted deacylase